MNTNIMTVLLIVCVVYLGIRELTAAKRHYDNKENKWAIASLIVGIFAFVCAVLASINF